MMMTIRAGALAAAVLSLSTAAASAAELVMLEQAGCVWCQRWHAEIGPAYPRTEEGKAAPLRTVDIDQPLPEDLAHMTVDRFTPTFVLMEDGEEIGRMRGYVGDEFFWVLLNEMLDRLEPSPAG